MQPLCLTSIASIRTQHGDVLADAELSRCQVDVCDVRLGIKAVFRENAGAWSTTLRASGASSCAHWQLMFL